MEGVEPGEDRQVLWGLGWLEDVQEVACEDEGLGGLGLGGVSKLEEEVDGGRDGPVGEHLLRRCPDRFVRRQGVEELLAQVI